MAYNNYLRAARLLLAVPGLNVNSSHRIGTPLEVAIEQGHADMVALLLTHPEVIITDRARQLAQEKPQIQKLLENRIAARSGISGASIAAFCGGNTGATPIPNYDNNLLAKYAQRFMKRKMGNSMPATDSQETFIEKWSPPAVCAALVVGVGYIVKKLFYSEKKEQKARA